MSWFAVDDRFHNHQKVLRLRRKGSQQYAQAVALWVLAGSWACSQDQERWTGQVPLDVLETLGVPRAREVAKLLIDVGLWEPVPGERPGVVFHNWAEWNGIDGKEYRSKEQARLRQQAYRLRRCQAGEHTKDCPPETCPKKQAKRPRNAALRDAGSGRDGSGGGTTDRRTEEEPTNGATLQLHNPELHSPSPTGGRPTP